MIRIDWFEKLELYNRIFNTNYFSIKVMLKNGYKRFGSLKEFACKLGVSDEALRQKLRKEEIKINDPIRPRSGRKKK